VIYDPFVATETENPLGVTAKGVTLISNLPLRTCIPVKKTATSGG